MTTLYEINAGSKHDLIRLTRTACPGKPQATLVSGGRQVVHFVPTQAQIKKIKQKKGWIRITDAAVGRANYLPCEEWPRR